MEEGVIFYFTFMPKEKTPLTPKRAQKIQDDIYYSMSAEKKIRLMSQFFVLGRELNKSMTIQSHGAGRITNQNK